MSRPQGSAAEDRAARFLTAHGMHVIDRNYRCRCGEIDLIARDGEHLVFVEVRLRRRVDFGTPFDSVDRRKQRKLVNTANHYLQRRRFDLPCRFDVVGIGVDDRVTWIRNAFDSV